MFDIPAIFSISAIDLISKLSTPVIAGFVAWIAFMQWRLNTATLREKLFERRFAIFKETQTFLSEILRDAKISDESLWNFGDTCQRSRFLFGKKMQNYLLEIRRRASKMSMHRSTHKDYPVGKERSKEVELEHNELEWLTDQLTPIFDRFEPYLQFAKHP
jgi:hypothetical protein